MEVVGKGGRCQEEIDGICGTASVRTMMSGSGVDEEINGPKILHACQSASKVTRECGNMKIDMDSMNMTGVYVHNLQETHACSPSHSRPPRCPRSQSQQGKSN